MPDRKVRDARLIHMSLADSSQYIAVWTDLVRITLRILRVWAYGIDFCCALGEWILGKVAAEHTFS